MSVLAHFNLKILEEITIQEEDLYSILRAQSCYLLRVITNLCPVLQRLLLLVGRV
jgi:hypothetical protein